VARNRRYVCLARWKAPRLTALALGMQASPASCQHVPHGVPLLPLCRKLPLKRALGTAGRFVVMCGGLLSPPKGVELVLKVRLTQAATYDERARLTLDLACMSQALPRIAASVPNVLLVVAGQAHPLLGRGYLKQLVELAASLGVSDLVEFHSSFLSEPDLLHMYQVQLHLKSCLCFLLLTCRADAVLRAQMCSSVHTPALSRPAAEPCCLQWPQASRWWPPLSHRQQSCCVTAALAARACLFRSTSRRQSPTQCVAPFC